MSTQKNKFVWPELGLDEREEAYNATPMFHNYATYEGIVKLKLSDLLLVEEYLGEVKQLARSKQIDPVTVKGITQSLSSVGVISDQPLMIVTELPNSSEKKYIVVEGNNRLAAFRNLAKNEGLNESTLNMNVMKVEITTEDFDFKYSPEKAFGQYFTELAGTKKGTEQLIKQAAGSPELTKFIKEIKNPLSHFYCEFIFNNHIN